MVKNNNKNLKKSINNILDVMIRFRYVIALIIFIACVIFGLHGSSMGEYDKVFPTHINEMEARQYKIIGKSRDIRSDEYAVHIPTYFSQKYNNYRKYSNQMSIDQTNMVLDYYAPIKDITLLAKPFNIGYVIFGNERGLSFYWCGLVLALFISSFEMFYILTKKNNILSIVGMCMIGFSPALQWWMIPHMPIVFVYAMMLFDLGYYLVVNTNKFLKWMFTILAGFMAAGFVLSIFPSCQIVAGAVSFVLLVTVLLRDREKWGITSELEKNIVKKNIYDVLVRVIVAGIIAVGIVGYVVLTSRADFKLLMNTVYPGKRISVGGDSTLKDIFTGLSSLTLAFRDSNVFNNSEVSTFIHFTPLFLMLFPSIARILRKEDSAKAKDELLIGKALFVCVLVEIVFMCIGFTPRLAKYTLFSYINRMQMGYGFTGVIFNIWSINIIWKYKDEYKKSQLILTSILYGLAYVMMITDEMRLYLPQKILILEIAILVVIALMALLRYKKLFAISMCIVMFLSGAFVNPVCTGISPITNHPISREIEKIVKKDSNSYWMVMDPDEKLISNFAMANGAKCLSATSFYPDFKKWNKLDPKGKENFVYNRYLNYIVSMTNEKTNIKLFSNDSVALTINPKDLKKIGVKYVLAKQKNEKILKQEKIEYKILCQQDGYSIYEIN